jgi:nucleoid DNA-binding protein
MKNKMVLSSLIQLIEKKKATMTPDQYKQMVANFIEQDTKLIAAYKKINLVPFQQFLLGRIRVCKLEIG